MKLPLILSLSFLSISSFASTRIEMPKKSENGYENVNNRKEYSYYGYEREAIWHEFGRPFWKSPKVANKTPKVIKQETRERLSSTKKKTVKEKLVKAQNFTLDVKFELNKDRIQHSFTDEINELGRALKANKDIKIEVQGHTDTTGALSFNNDLSSKRAMAVKKYLMENFSIKGERLISKGFGPKKPVASNEIREGREKNRRVEIKVIR